MALVIPELFTLSTKQNFLVILSYIVHPVQNKRLVDPNFHIFILLCLNDNNHRSILMNHFDNDKPCDHIAGVHNNSWFVIWFNDRFVFCDMSLVYFVMPQSIKKTIRISWQNWQLATEARLKRGPTKCSLKADEIALCPPRFTIQRGKIWWKITYSYINLIKNVFFLEMLNNGTFSSALVTFIIEMVWIKYVSLYPTYQKFN